jgi:hypothetical protein
MNFLHFNSPHVIGAMNMELKLPPSVPAYKPTDYFNQEVLHGCIPPLAKILRESTACLPPQASNLTFTRLK